MKDRNTIVLVGVCIAIAIFVVVLIITSGIHSNMSPIEHAAKKWHINKDWRWHINKKEKEKHKLVAMVGDGTNDAPASAASDVGIAIGSGTDVAKETGGIVLIKDDVRDVVLAIDLSKKTVRKIKENLFWAFIYNIALIPIAAGVLYPSMGILMNPIYAAIAMASSSVTVVTNSMLMKRYKPKILESGRETSRANLERQKEYNPNSIGDIATETEKPTQHA